MEPRMSEVESLSASASIGNGILGFHRTHNVEVVTRDGDLAVVSLLGGAEAVKSIAWLEGALQRCSFVSVQRLPGLAAVVVVPVEFLEAAVPPPSAVIERAWVPLKVASVAHVNLNSRPESSNGDTQAPSLLVLARLGNALAAAGVPWRALAQGGSTPVVLVRRRDLHAATFALVHAGHAVRPASLACPLVPEIPLARTPANVEVPGAGAWVLAWREEPVGTTSAEFAEPADAPLRIRARCGVHVEVHIPALGSGLNGHRSRAGFCDTVAHAGWRAEVTYNMVDFRPPIGTWIRSIVAGGDAEGDLMEVTALPPARHREIWRRLGGAREVVALELVEDPQQRVGFWLFCGRRFARVLGFPRGKGLVAGSCCRSLEQLAFVHGAQALEAELRAHYEAVVGEVEKPGLFRVLRDTWRPDRVGKPLYSAIVSTVDGTAVTANGTQIPNLTLRLPGNRLEKWRVHEWAFDPFGIPTFVLGPHTSVKHVNAKAHSCSSSPSAKPKKRVDRLEGPSRKYLRKTRGYSSSSRDSASRRRLKRSKDRMKKSRKSPSESQKGSHRRRSRSSSHAGKHRDPIKLSNEGGQPLDSRDGGVDFHGGEVTGNTRSSQPQLAATLPADCDVLSSGMSLQPQSPLDMLSMGSPPPPPGPSPPPPSQGVMTDGGDQFMSPRQPPPPPQKRPSGWDRHPNGMIVTNDLRPCNPPAHLPLGFPPGTVQSQMFDPFAPVVETPSTGRMLLGPPFVAKARSPEPIGHPQPPFPISNLPSFTSLQERISTLIAGHVIGSQTESSLRNAPSFVQEQVLAQGPLGIGCAYPAREEVESRMRFAQGAATHAFPLLPWAEGTSSAGGASRDSCTSGARHKTSISQQSTFNMPQPNFGAVPPPSGGMGPPGRCVSLMSQPSFKAVPPPSM